MSSIFDSLERDDSAAIRIIITPEMAVEMLDANRLNRPLDQNTINRIVRQITKGLWKFNGDTIKISADRDILDGQHRLWAVIEAKRPIETLIAFGVSCEAFDTIDTLRKFRTLGDTIALEGQVRYRAHIGTALSWLIRYEQGILETYKTPIHKIENSDIKEAFRANPNIVQAVSRTAPMRRLVNVPIMAFFYYVLSMQNAGLAEQMVETLIDPSRTKITHPYYLLRAYFASDLTKKDPVKTIALMIKSSNAVYNNANLTRLEWTPQGKSPDRFPVLDVRNIRKQEQV